MEVVHAIHLSPDLKWEFDPAYDAKEVFQKLQVIGKGGFGTVCKVLHIPSQTVLAGKLINPILVKGPDSKKEIEHEITLMKEVESSYTIHYYGSVQFEGSMMILMEYCDCGSLRNILDVREQVLSEDQIAIVMRDLLLGLQVIHTRYRIVHRDIKAANILLTSSGGIRIADFGVSRRFEKTGTIHTMTIVGTPYWMAPEVINGTAYSFPADLWSVGITAVELAEGAPPYVELAPTKAMIEIFVKGFPGYRFKKMHSPEFMDFVSHCVQKKDTDRWDIPHLLEHPFIKRAERMPRLEVLKDLIKCGLKIGKSQSNDFSQSFSKNNNTNTGANSDIFSFSTQKNASGANLNSATNFDNFGSEGGAVQLRSAKNFFSSEGGTDLKQLPGLLSFSGAPNNGFDSAALNSGANFGIQSGFGGGFDSAALRSRTDFAQNNFDSASLNSGTNFGVFGTGGGNNFDSAALNSATNFDSFAAAHKNSFDSPALNSGANFDSFTAAHKNGFDSAALNSGTNFSMFGGNGFDSASLNSGTNFGVFGTSGGNNFDSAALNSGTNFDSFEAAHKSGFDSAALNSGTNFDSFEAAHRNGFDSAALNSGTNFDSFEAAHRNGFDSASLNSGTNFGMFGSGNNFDSASLNSSTNFDSFVANRSPSLKPSSGFDSFASSQSGFDSLSLNSGASNSPNLSTTSKLDSSGLNSPNEKAGGNLSQNSQNFVQLNSANLLSSAGFNSFASNYGQNNGFDSASLNSSGNFDSFAGGYGQNNGFDSFSLNSSGKFDSFASTNGANLKSSTGFDSFSGDINSHQLPNGFESFEMSSDVPNQSASSAATASETPPKAVRSPLPPLPPSAASKIPHPKPPLPPPRSPSGQPPQPPLQAASGQPPQPPLQVASGQPPQPPLQAASGQPPQPPLQVASGQPPQPPLQTDSGQLNHSGIPHVTFNVEKDDLYRQAARSYSLKTPCVNYNSLVQMAKDGKQIPPVVYQQDDAMLEQQKINLIKQRQMMIEQQKRKLEQPLVRPEEDEEEKIQTWSPPWPIVVFLIVATVAYGPEGFVISLWIVLAFSFAFSYGKKNVKPNQGLVPKNFKKD